ncbi:DUF504 domain-containing protein [Candidatus Woesearchaeota archaeon]|nr:DUF504 domain-containing protein [Candidatus Woesearchaeota archaeon]
MNAKEMLNKIKWSDKEPEKYLIFYADRKSEKLAKVAFREINNFEGNFLVVEKDGKETEIPLHRIREIRKQEKLVWRRGL